MSDWDIDESKSMSQEELKKLYEDALSVMANEKEQKVEPYFSVCKDIRAIVVFISGNHISDIILHIITTLHNVCAVYQGIYSTVRDVQYTGNHSVLNIPQCTHGTPPPLYSMVMSKKYLAQSFLPFYQIQAEL